MYKTYANAKRKLANAGFDERGRMPTYWGHPDGRKASIHSESGGYRVAIYSV